MPRASALRGSPSPSSMAYHIIAPQMHSQQHHQLHSHSRLVLLPHVERSGTRWNLDSELPRRLLVCGRCASLAEPGCFRPHAHTWRSFSCYLGGDMVGCLLAAFLLRQASWHFAATLCSQCHGAAAGHWFLCAMAGDLAALAAQCGDCPGSPASPCRQGEAKAGPASCRGGCSLACPAMCLLCFPFRMRYFRWRAHLHFNVASRSCSSTAAMACLAARDLYAMQKPSGVAPCLLSCLGLPLENTWRYLLLFQH